LLKVPPPACAVLPANVQLSRKTSVRFSLLHRAPPWPALALLAARVVLGTFMCAPGRT